MKPLHCVPDYEIYVVALMWGIYHNQIISAEVSDADYSKISAKIILCAGPVIPIQG
jgi:hypothetical protein